MNIQISAVTKATAIVIVALLLAIAVLPASTASGSCAGSDDYGLCVASVGSASGVGVPHPGDGPAGLPVDHPLCDDDPDSANPPCASG